uniref:Protein kinase domain-containing protein n=1 Tax=Parastrongyloides trichosuri TaxID=131310 RepID=A0A0N4ZHZ1_PARTI
MNQRKNIVPIISVNVNEESEDENYEINDDKRKNSLTIPSFNGYSSTGKQNNYYRKPSTCAFPTIGIIEESSPAQSTRNNSFSSNEYCDNIKDDEYVTIPKCFQGKFLINENDFNGIIKIKRLGKGNHRFGKVYKFLETNEMIEMAGTRLKLEELATWDQNSIVIQKQLNELLEEIKSFTELRHPNVIKYFGCYKTSEKLTMYREYLPNGSVDDRIEKGCIFDVLAIKWLRQTAEALKYLHGLEAPIIHKNLKTSNMLLTISEDIKLSDIGYNIQINTQEDYDETSSNSNNLYRKSLFMTAPEQLIYIREPYKFTKSNDIWNLGCIFVQMLTQKLPYEEQFKDMNDSALYRHLQDNLKLPLSDRLQYRSKNLIENANEDVKEIIDNIFLYSEDVRPTANEILNYEAVKVNRRLFEVHPLPMAKKRRNSYSRRQSEISGYSRNNIDEKPVRVIARNGKKEKVFSPLLKRFVSMDSNDINSDDDVEAKVEEIDSGDDILTNLSDPKITDNKYIAKYFTSKFFLFLTFFVKWSILILLTALTVFCFASFVVIAIFLIYDSMNFMCQCHLNEGFIVLIALILLPIMILLGSLCCNNACQRLYYPQPEKDIKMCGVIVVIGSKHQEKSVSYKRKKVDDDDPTAPMNLEKGKIVNDIAKLA